MASGRLELVIMADFLDLAASPRLNPQGSARVSLTKIASSTHHHVDSLSPPSGNRGREARRVDGHGNEAKPCFPRCRVSSGNARQSYGSPSSRKMQQGEQDRPMVIAQEGLGNLVDPEEVTVDEEGFPAQDVQASPEDAAQPGLEEFHIAEPVDAEVVES